MRRLGLALALSCMLSGTVLAGEIPSGDRIPPGLRAVAVGEIATCDQTPQSASTDEIAGAGVTELESSAMVFRILLSIFSIVR